MRPPSVNNVQCFMSSEAPTNTLNRLRSTIICFIGTIRVNCCWNWENNTRLWDMKLVLNWPLPPFNTTASCCRIIFWHQEWPRKIRFSSKSLPRITQSTIFTIPKIKIKFECSGGWCAITMNRIERTRLDEFTYPPIVWIGKFTYLFYVIDRKLIQLLLLLLLLLLCASFS